MLARKPKKVVDQCRPVSVKQGTQRRLLVFCEAGHLMACMRVGEFKGSRIEAQLKSYLASLRTSVNT